MIIIQVQLRRVVERRGTPPRSPLSEREIKQAFGNVAQGRLRIRALQVQDVLASLGLGFFTVEEIKSYIHLFDRGFSGSIVFDELCDICKIIQDRQRDLQPRTSYMAEGACDKEARHSSAWTGLL